ncbi:DMT family transporter [Arthrobacter sp. KN11-1C]|uniref:DMT family transporter n=1 Tax=Arthrobacter sp. KN11-1C TaxID=3445774 RepID=UPI003F9F7E47
MAGAAVSLQSFVNGRLGESLGSALTAAAVNNGAALAIVLLLAILSGAVPRALRELRSGRSRVRLWWFFGGVAGAMAVSANAVAAPIVGLAFLTVALVFGQLLGGILADAWGVGPAGRQLPSRRRLAGAFGALAGVAVGALDQTGQSHPVILISVVAGGAAVAFQQAGNAHLVRSTGEPLAMGLINFLVGATVLFLGLAISATSLVPLSSLPGWAWTGGALGAAVGIFGPIAAKNFGVLRLFLGMVAGQCIAALVIDVILLPGSGRGPSIFTIAGILLACASVFIANGRPGGHHEPTASGSRNPR